MRLGPSQLHAQPFGFRHACCWGLGRGGAACPCDKDNSLVSDWMAAFGVQMSQILTGSRMLVQCFDLDITRWLLMKRWVTVGRVSVSVAVIVPDTGPVPDPGVLVLLLSGLPLLPDSERVKVGLHCEAGDC